MSMLERFRDSEYKNWLRCVNAQISLKESLHVFVDIELKTLHMNMSKQVKQSVVGSNPTVQCSLCRPEDIHQKPAKGHSLIKWSITCPSNICNVWLNEILAVHNDSNSKSINWQNSDVSLWAVEPYEIAKVFMPRGADKAKAFPQDLDLPAIITLMKMCKAFNKYNLNDGLLQDLINIRNKLYHTGDFKINDTLRDLWIDKMLQLVTMLNLQCTVFSELSMVKTDDISINLGETESRVFQELVFNRFHHIETEMNSLQNTQVQLTTDIRQVMECTSNAGRRTDLLHADLSEIRTQVEEITTVSDKVSNMEQQIEEKEQKVLETKQIKSQRKHNGICGCHFLSSRELGFNALFTAGALSLAVASDQKAVYEI